MGTWGYLPWDNDLAADWFVDLFEQTRLAERVAETLELAVAEYHEEIRAAAYVLIQLGHPYIWPAERLDGDLTLAAERLQEMLQAPKWREECAGQRELVEAVESEIATLKARIGNKPNAVRDD